MMGELRRSDLSRIARAGLRPLSAQRGLELFDAAHAAADALVFPMQIDMRALRDQARGGATPAPLLGLVRTPSRRLRSSAEGSLARRLASAPERERPAIALEAVRAEVATVVGHGSADAIEPERPFKDLGLDSLAAVELRNRLNTVTGLRLPAALVFDHPTPVQLAEHLSRALAPSPMNGSGAPEDAERRIRDILASIPIERLRDAGLMDALVRLAVDSEETSPATGDETPAIDALDVASLVRRAHDGVDDPSPGEVGDQE
jgi:acyl carrier protein